MTSENTHYQLCYACVPLCVHLFFSLVSIKELENEKSSLQSDAEHYSSEVANLNYVLV